jgi:hypothetical protein
MNAVAYAANVALLAGGRYAIARPDLRCKTFGRRTSAHRGANANVGSHRKRADASSEATRSS